MSKQSLSFPTEVTIFIDAISREAANRLYRLPRKVHIFYKTKTLANCKKFIYPTLPTKEARKSIYGDIRELISKHDDFLKM